jgi:hypothetical protein
MLRQPTSSNLAEAARTTSRPKRVTQPTPPRTYVDLVGRLRNPYRQYTAKLCRTAYVSAQVEKRAKNISAQRVFREHHQIRTDAQGRRAISKTAEDILHLTPPALILIALVLLVFLKSGDCITTLQQGIRNML